ncbi:BlaI/MecI/CopY family transcriptional regulator [Nonomuraea sp. NPDC005650]|uniref:BlaI/MecI/CopY family transcriptional regulator n=1 Tax=Nonomuraea sp. NPDC005650 TaxID=3157045 RepID=UPI0033A995F5
MSESPRRPGRRSPGVLEQEILACLTEAGRPLTPGEVQAQLGGELAYTTVMTTLARLHKRGLAEREPSGRAYAYRVASDAEAAQSIAVAAQMSRLLGKGRDRAGVLAHFVADLDPEDEQLLTELLRGLEDDRQGRESARRTMGE